MGEINICTACESTIALVDGGATLAEEDKVTPVPYVEMKEDLGSLGTMQRT
jgi:hypothetical protein